jgi:PAS domain S-box-containing protein
VENSVYGIFRSTADGAFLDVNPALLQILGCSTIEEARALNLVRDIFRYPEQYLKFLGACREHGQLHGAEAEWRRRDGGMVTVRLHLRRIAVSDHPDFLEVMAEDVTELRAMERQLRQAQKFEAIGQLANSPDHIVEIVRDPSCSVRIPVPPSPR